jgi:Lantibiotic dehydratase, N terminus
MVSAGGWRLLPHFVVRSAGFPFDWMEGLRLPETARLLDELLGRPDGPGAAGLRAAAERAFESELAGARRHLASVFADPLVADAVLLSSPSMHAHGLRKYLERWDAGPRNSELRRIERQLTMYLQRLCARNDTVAFFGPVDYGSPGEPGPASAPVPGARHVRRCRAFVAHWAVSALAAAIAGDPELRPHLTPRLNPAFVREGGLVRLGRRPYLCLLPGGCRLVEAMDGQATVAELGATLGRPVLDDVEALAAAGVVWLRLEVPVTEIGPLTWLTARVGAMPASPSRDRWCGVLRRFAELEERFAAAGPGRMDEALHALEALFAEVTGRPTRRGQGQMYADRLVVHEECLGGLTPLDLGPAFHRELERQLVPILDLMAALACEAYREEQAEAAAWLDQRGGRVPLLSLLAGRRPPTGERILAGAERRRLLALIPPGGTAREVRLPAVPLPGDPPPLMASPDVLLVAGGLDDLRHGRFRLVLGECHDTVMVWGWALGMHPDGHRVEQEAAALIERAGAGRPLANALSRRTSRIAPFEYPGPTVELLAASGRPPGERIPVAAVDVVRAADGCRLTAPGWPEFRLYNGELTAAEHRVVGLPRVVPPALESARRTPRLLVGDAVVQRERWRLGRADLIPRRYRGTSLDLMLDVRRSARALGLPRRFYVRGPGQPKPVFVDIDSNHCLEVLDHVLPAGGEAIVTEMLPEPEQLWLRSGGDRYCCELRLSAFWVPEEAGP